MMDPTAIAIRSLSMLVIGSVAFAEDFKLSDGTILRGARVVEVRPDALVVAHEKGVSMADLDKLPKGLRARYGYDPKKAASFRERDLTARRAVAEENRRLIAAHEERKRTVARAEWESANADGLPATGSGEIRFTPRESTSERAFVADVGSQIDRAEEARRAANAPVTFWTHPIWKVLQTILGTGGSGGRDTESTSEPRNWR